MAAAARFANGNRLLQTLSAADLGLLEPDFVPVSVKVYHHFEYPNKAIENVYFPDVGIASVVAEQPNGTKIEIGIIGCEGMSGAAIVLGNDRSSNSTYVQIAGEGRQISAKKLREALKESRTLQSSLLKFVQAFMTQTAHTAIANARAKLPERLARWLLMAHDRMPGNQLALTHEFLSLMLAVRRAGVTETVNDLESKGLIETARGEIAVRNRRGLEKLAGNFYGVPEAEYRRLFN